MRSKSALLADEMGLGKTVQVAVAIRELHDLGRLRRTMIVAPASLLTNWMFEIASWAPGVAVRTSLGLSADQRSVLWSLPIPIIIASYEAVRSDFLLRSPVRLLDLVVFDEAQRLKNEGSDVSLAARHIPAERRWALSATPFENKISDLLALSRAIGLPTTTESEPSIPDLVETFQGHFLRRRKADVLPELPPILSQDLPLRLVGSQRDEYESARRYANLDGDSMHLLAVISSLKHICNKGSDDSSVKLDALLEIIRDPGMGEGRVVVISQYTRTLRWVASQLPIRTIMYTGGMSYAERDKALGVFRNGATPTALLLSLKAGGVGLNIPEATHVVLFDRWWNPSAEEQAIHRAHRLGRNIPLHVYRFRVVDSIEDRILKLLAERQQTFDELVEGVLTESSFSHSWRREDFLRVLQ